MEKKVSQDQVQKALEALKGLSGETVAKGGNGPLTAASGEASATGAGTQLYQGKDSFDSVRTFAGTTTADVNVRGDVSANGTDFSAASFAKSVMESLSSGKITAEQAISLLKAMPFPPKGEPDGDECDEDEKLEKKDAKKATKKVEKSFADHAAEEAGVGDTLEVSEFLTGIVNAISKALDSHAERVVKSVSNLILANSDKQEGFNKSLAGAVVALGEGLSATSSRIEQVEAQPARGPKSAEPGIAKSFGGESNLSRQDILATLTDMVTVSKSVSPHAVVKFESTGEISNDLLKAVVAHRAAR